MAVALWHGEVWEWGPVELQTGLEKALAVTFLYKNIHNFLKIKLAPTINFAWIAFLALSLEGSTGIGFGDVRHLWIRHKLYRNERSGIHFLHPRAGSNEYLLLWVSGCLCKELCQAMRGLE